ncbi:MAG TPA: DegT/DnrJ/EryC1/StrS family aminotransferase [Arachnia sp.]|nr:DegT/DnrJ/EryC1/StrS family aminotransferase [Arachnia sp.]
MIPRLTMIPRGVLDLSAADLRFAARQCAGPAALPDDALAAAAAVERAWDPDGRTLACLSLRSGWDLALLAARWPPGSEILMSAVTIGEMAEIVRRHRLVPVPVDIDPRTLAIDPAQLEPLVTSRTRGLVATQLFGSRTPLGPLATVARKHRLMVFEDAAQAYTGLADRGDAAADISGFSFGPIKPQTALGGGLLEVRDPELLSRMRRIQDGWPRQQVADYRSRVRKFGWVGRLARNPTLFAALAWSCRAVGRDHDQLLAGAIRGFGHIADDELLAKIRRQPSLPLLRLLFRRLDAPERTWMARKNQLAEIIRAELPADCRMGEGAPFPTHWVLPVLAEDPCGVRDRLRAAGFDATRSASSLTVIATPAERPDALTPLASRWISRLVYLPLHPALTDARAVEMARLVG